MVLVIFCVHILCLMKLLLPKFLRLIPDRFFLSDENHDLKSWKCNFTIHNNIYSVSSKFRTFLNAWKLMKYGRFSGCLFIGPAHSCLLNSGNFQNAHFWQFHVWSDFGSYTVLILVRFSKTWSQVWACRPVCFMSQSL